MISVGCGYSEQIGIAIVENILPLGNGGFDKPEITHSFAAAVSPDHFSMHAQDALDGQEERRFGAHFANFCKASP